MKLIVKSVPEKFCRAGICFTREPLEVDVDKKTAERLKAEPMLTVEIVTSAASAPSGSG